MQNEMNAVIAHLFHGVRKMVTHCLISAVSQTLTCFRRLRFLARISGGKARSDRKFALQLFHRDEALTVRTVLVRGFLLR